MLADWPYLSVLADRMPMMATRSDFYWFAITEFKDSSVHTQANLSYRIKLIPAALYMRLDKRPYLYLSSCDTLTLKCPGDTMRSVGLSSMYLVIVRGALEHCHYIFNIQSVNAAYDVLVT